jgi:hypothetical protein
MIIPIGVDCGMAEFFKKYNLRGLSLPFNWTVTYNGVSNCIDNNFNNFIESLDTKRINMYDIYFHHDFNNINTYDDDKKNILEDVIY